MTWSPPLWWLVTSTKVVKTTLLLLDSQNIASFWHFPISLNTNRRRKKHFSIKGPHRQGTDDSICKTNYIILPQNQALSIISEIHQTEHWSKGTIPHSGGSHWPYYPPVLIFKSLLFLTHICQSQPRVGTPDTPFPALAVSIPTEWGLIYWLYPNALSFKALLSPNPCWHVYRVELNIPHLQGNGKCSCGPWTNNSLIWHAANHPNRQWSSLHFQGHPTPLWISEHLEAPHALLPTILRKVRVSQWIHQTEFTKLSLKLRLSSPSLFIALVHLQANPHRSKSFKSYMGGCSSSDTTSKPRPIVLTYYNSPSYGPFSVHMLTATYLHPCQMFPSLIHYPQETKNFSSSYLQSL